MGFVAFRLRRRATQTLCSTVPLAKVASLTTDMTTCEKVHHALQSILLRRVITRRFASASFAARQPGTVDMHPRDGVAHMIAQESSTIKDVMTTDLGVSVEAAMDLVRLGSVWRFRGALSEAAIGTEKAAWMRRHGGHVDTSRARRRDLGKWHRERDGDSRVHHGDLLRIHTRPKRYPRHAKVDWSQQILLCNQDLVVLSKPWGVLSVPSRDNAFESCVEALQQLLTQKLYPCHQLDACAEGSLLLARSSSMAETIMRDFAAVEKIYRVLCQAPVPVGLHRHYLEMEMEQPDGADEQTGGIGIPRRNLVVEEHLASKRAKHAELEVLSCSSAPGGFAVEVRLLTGRTHQIRTQLATLGAPIVGDTLYGAPHNTSPQRIALQAYRVRVPALELTVEAGDPWWHADR